MRASLVFAIVIAAAAVAALIFRPDRLLEMASASTSQNICAGTFVTGLDPDRTYAEEVRPEGGMGLIAWVLRYDVDRTARQVSTTIFGVFKTSSAFQEGFGCRLVHAGAVPLAGDFAPISPLASDIAGPELVITPNPGLARALDKAFALERDGVARHTRAVVIVHDGKIVAERYAPGIGIGTPLLSHSVAKSVTNALIGILVREGKLSLTQTVKGPAWHTPATVEQLMRMAAGLPLDEGIGPGASQRMWFTTRDNDAFAEAAPQVGKPGEAWAYGNLVYAVLSRLVRDKAGATPQSVANFARNELFAPLGMTHALMEFDGAGSPMGGNAFYASARDWARLGLFYLNDGVANGQRIPPEGWVAMSTRQTLDAGYGAGFWLNVTDAPMRAWPGARWGLPGAPKDAYFARGYLGQFVVVVPSERLVVVRFGASHIRGGDIESVGALVRDTIEAIR